MSAQVEKDDIMAWAPLRPTRTYHNEFPPPLHDEQAPLRLMLDSGDGYPAACKVDLDPDRWMNNSPREQMQRLCRVCPIQRACLDYALHNDVTGYWSGTTYAQRNHMRERAGIVAERLSMTRRPAGGATWE